MFFCNALSITHKPTPLQRQTLLHNDQHLLRQFAIEMTTKFISNIYSQCTIAHIVLYQPQNLHLLYISLSYHVSL